MSKIILASASPRRKELLAKAGISFTVIPAAGEEKRTSEDPGEAVQQLARDKAEWVAQSMAECEEGTLVIGSDTIVVFENRILGKPKDRRDAAETLEKLQGNTHQVYTGVSVLERKGSRIILGSLWKEFIILLMKHQSPSTSSRILLIRSVFLVIRNLALKSNL